MKLNIKNVITLRPSYFKKQAIQTEIKNKKVFITDRPSTDT